MAELTSSPAASPDAHVMDLVLDKVKKHVLSVLQNSTPPTCLRTVKSRLGNWPRRPSDHRRG